MSTSGILPAPTVDFNGSSSTPSQQTVFNNLLNQLTQAIDGGDLTTAGTLYNALTALSPGSTSGSDALGTFFTSLGTALNDGSASEAQTALTTYQSEVPTATASTGSSATDTSATAAQIASGLIMSQIQANTVSAVLGAVTGSTSSGSSSNSTNDLLNILSAAYPVGGSSSSSGTSSSATSGSSSSDSAASPYDTLVSALQANLSAGTDPTTTALSYLNSAGNFVNTTA